MRVGTLHPHLAIGCKITAFFATAPTLCKQNSCFYNL